jgi:hypothetical protein
MGTSQKKLVQLVLKAAKYVNYAAPPVTLANRQYAGV